MVATKHHSGASSERRRPSSASKAGDSSNSGDSTGERLQKVLALCGAGSRRACEDLILAGRVQVDGETVTVLGTRVEADRQTVHVDGVPLARPKLVYYALHKPPGVVSTNRDPSGRPQVVDLIPSKERLFCVGRLDKSSEGLMLLTNDGELSNRLAHPRYGVEKVYLVETAGQLDQDHVAKLRRGVHIAEGLARVDGIVIKRKNKRSTVLEITLKEGRNREIRRLLAAVGNKVLRLRRIAIGPLKLGDLPSGEHRKLAFQEVQRLANATNPGKYRWSNKPTGKRTGKGTGKRAGNATAKPTSKPTSKPTGKAKSQSTKKQTKAPNQNPTTSARRKRKRGKSPHE